jgi:hypothetical protein
MVVGSAPDTETKQPRATIANAPESLSQNPPRDWAGTSAGPVAAERPGRRSGRHPSPARPARRRGDPAAGGRVRSVRSYLQLNG